MSAPMDRRIAPAAALLFATLPLALGGCLSPRDADLEQRVAQAVMKQRLEQASTASGPEGPAKSASGASAAPPAKVLKTYSEADIKRIMGSVPGDGTTLTMTLKTRIGTIQCTLDREGAPQTVTNVVALATSQVTWTDPDTKKKSKNPFYKGLPFHRLVQNFLIQTGNPAVTSGRGPAWRSKGPGWVIAREHTADKHYDKGGALGMVDAGEDSHGSQFFITTKRATHLKNKYAAFGFCENLDVVTRIANAPKLNPEQKKPTKPKDPVHIDSMEIRWVAGK